MEAGSLRSAPRTWPGARQGSATRRSPAARCGGRSGARRRTAGRRSWRPPGRRLSRESCFRRRGTREPGCTSTAASRTWPSRRCRWPAGSTSSSPTSPTSGCPRLSGGGGGVGAGCEPVPLTPADGGFRFADLVLARDGQEIWCVRETVRAAGDGAGPDGFHIGGGVAVRRDIVAVPLDGSAASDAGALRVLVSGAQFFAFPTPSPDGTRLAWINWNHPNMPWDGTELRVAPVTGATVRVADAALVMGGQEESVLAPLWRDEATLYVISDASGWWNLYEVAAAAGAAPRALHPVEEEFTGPLWQLGGRPFELLDDGRLAVLHGLGERHLAVLDPVSGALADIDLPGYRTTHGDLAVSGAVIV